MAFPGGSAWAMARDISEGVQLVTERTFKTMTRTDLDQLGFEIDRVLRDFRGAQAPLDDLAAIQQRNRRIQRLTGCLAMLRAYRTRMKM